MPAAWRRRTSASTRFAWNDRHDGSALPTAGGQPLFLSPDPSPAAPTGGQASRAPADSVVDDSALMAEIDLAHAQMMERLEAQREAQLAIERAAQAGTIFASIGALNWLARAGGLVAAAMSYVPLWRFVDPVTVLAADRERQAAFVEESARAGRYEDRAGKILDRAKEGAA